MLSVGALIWISIRPLLRLVLCASTGFVITKVDIFPPIAARGAGQIMLNVALPSLMFSKIVPAFTPQNIGALGPLVLVAALYQILGIFTGWIVKQVFWVPHRFRYGILVAGGWGNYGDVPTAVIMTITGSAPFNGTADQTLSVAYISAFILVFFISLFPMGGHRLVAWDYVGPEVEDDEIRMSMRAKTKASMRCWVGAVRDLVHRITEKKFKPHDDPESSSTEKEVIESPVEKVEDAPSMHFMSRQHAPVGSIGVSFYPEDSTAAPTEVMLAASVCSPMKTETAQSRAPSPAYTITQLDALGTRPMDPHSSVRPTTSFPSRSSLMHRICARLISSLKSLMTPPALAILTAFPIAIITPIKALFTPVPNSRIPNAPDGQPPLAFLLDTATFIGGASVPLGLICLGSALARLKVPRNQWRSLPMGAIAWLAIGKMLIMPVLGVLICDGLVSVGFINSEDKVLRFVCIFFSCVPTATTQVTVWSLFGIVHLLNVSDRYF